MIFKNLKKLQIFIFACIILLSGCGSEESAANLTRPSDSVNTEWESGVQELSPGTQETESIAQKGQDSPDVESAAPETTGIAGTPKPLPETSPESLKPATIVLSAIPAYAGQPYAEVNNNIPLFTSSEITTASFETYSPLDSLGRCGVASSCIGRDIMPTQERGQIGQVKPSGWHLVKYDHIDGLYLYNRCHLIGYQLAGENANEKNLITGTRYLNVTGMLPFENRVADYVKSTGNHVMYRATPMYEGNNLLASGVLLEALSVEDGGKGIKFNVFIYNVQPGVIIDYSNGDSRLQSSGQTDAATTETAKPTETQKPAETVKPTQAAKPAETVKPTEAANAGAGTKNTYVLNTNTKKFHYTSCSDVLKMSQKNKKIREATREEIIQSGYSPCGHCKP